MGNFQCKIIDKNMRLLGFLLVLFTNFVLKFRKFEYWFMEGGF